MSKRASALQARSSLFGNVKKETLITVNNNNLSQQYQEQQEDATERQFQGEISSARKNAQVLKDLALGINDDLTGDLQLLDKTNNTAEGTRIALRSTMKNLSEMMQVKTTKHMFILTILIVVVFFIVYYSMRYAIRSYLVGTGSTTSPLTTTETQIAAAVTNTLTPSL